MDLMKAIYDFDLAVNQSFAEALSIALESVFSLV
jgi:hypothetical protein